MTRHPRRVRIPFQRSTHGSRRGTQGCGESGVRGDFPEGDLQEESVDFLGEVELETPYPQLPLPLPHLCPIPSHPPSFSTPTSRHAALLTRNPLATSSFTYAVTTTRIYCRPDCPSRLARRSNILFYDTASLAERAGYRACLRCRPEIADGVEHNSQTLAVSKAKKLLGEEERRWTVKALAKEVGMTESHFCRVFKRGTGMRVSEYRVFIKEVGSRDAAARSEESEVVGAELALDEDVNAGEKDADTTFDFAGYEVGVGLDMTPSLDVSVEQSEGDCFEFLDFEVETETLGNIV
ncbi:Ada DNA repair protein, N-terminal (N-Ada 10) [Glarea lozoyensis ATCC 20868]|uniref:Ada DNA repair protein, N-terminal (N-Ada 10) n=1 Tax=Glarea lozoyensis (strain ATCC 20868 / MF5171) TaxID=1116229 RepID=S3CR07_GLAL2|nr:Ada DNA repair protein, N-terminal (N-Ada 10) [Glarea lozoyensis ATCC 20868]EPE28110.1 Ada DNA repair protein, N-terminal (N-Ada 10) [Glarea lozoyensis ATCC 20868]